MDRVTPVRLLHFITALSDYTGILINFANGYNGTELCGKVGFDWNALRTNIAVFLISLLNSSEQVPEDRLIKNILVHSDRR